MRIEQIGDATLYCADCRDVLPTLGGVDAVVTDPPYGVGKAAWDKHFPGPDFWRLLSRACSFGSSLILFPGEVAIDAKLPILTQYFTYQWVLVWYKPNAMQFGKTGFSKMSLAWWLSRGPKSRAKPSMIDIFERPLVGSDNDFGHPSPKPLNVCEPLVQNFSCYADIVLDPFMGSGTTGVACARLGRKFIGIEIHEPYFDIACRRIEEAQRQRDLFIHAPAANAPEDTRMADLFAAAD